MTTSRPQVLDGIARLHERLRGLPLDVPAGIEARLLLTRITTLVSTGPVLALPWNEKPQPDRKCLAAADDTFTHP
jgi:hypothetical protein